MAYFAQIDSDGIVVQVIKISNDDAPDPAPINSEPLGQVFIADVLGLPGNWRQTSIAPQPYPSWTLNTDTAQWEPPISTPETGGPWQWNEDIVNWQEMPMSTS